MTEAEAARRKLDMYLGEVRGVLRGLDPSETEEILAELRSHVLDRVGGEAGLNEPAVQAALDGLGAARTLGAGYVGRRMVEKVEKDRSPWRILAAVYRLASLSVGGFLLFWTCLVGYVLGAGLIFIAVLKPFAPRQVGMWAHGQGDDLSISLGWTDYPAGTELMGWWVIPFALIAGAAVLYLTRQLSLAGVRALGRGGVKRRAG